ncbi:addiction module toxin RelE [Alkalibacterium kapii]|uniref:Addiction module toxin RelE n=1 Tax=Alkalibacterium kapii TaxID=426704 RepID=A0A511AVT8_9LACT|nr:addiction module toxin RelE [Alkalibacterium kapii]GEK91241.1 hypothetical protein AKA01nite_08630 [Alkalibacterium kapii]
MTYHIKLNKLSKEDYNKLDGSQKKLIDKSLKKLELQGMQAGEWLHGSLSDCKKIKHTRAGLRVVFKESENSIEIIDIITIGKRSNKEVYKITEKRLKNDK